MNVTNERKSSVLRALHLGALALVLCAAMPNAWAKQHKPDPSQAVMVVAHIPFQGESPSDMAIHTTANGDRYLYVEHSPGLGISILDLAKASNPILISSVAWPATATAHIRDVPADAVLLTETNNNSEASQPATQPASNTLVLWDVSHPTKPTVLQQFADIRRVLVDDRGYVYILNADGLWVISTPTAYRQSQPDPFKTFWVCVQYANEAQSPSG